MVHSLVHVHGAIYIASNRAEPGKQPSKARAHGGCEADHDFEWYAEAIHAAVARHLDEMEAFRGELHRQALSPECSPVQSTRWPTSGEQRPHQEMGKALYKLNSVHQLASVQLNAAK